MGRNSNRPWRAGKPTGSQDWQLWRGSWGSPSQRPQQDAGKARFPRYDAAVPANAASGNVAPAQPAAAKGPLQTFQTALNVARKAEQKVIKIQAAQDTLKQQWVTFEKNLQKTFLEEKARHVNDLARLASDLGDAMGCQEQARAALVQLVATGQTPGMQEEAAMDQTWAQLTATWEQEAQAGMSGVLQRAMQAAPAMITATTVGATPSPRAMEDPYAALGGATESPSNLAHVMQRHAMPSEVSPAARPPGLHPGQRDNSRPRVPTADAPPRSSIKDATKQAPAPDATGIPLAAKLDAARAAEMQRLRSAAEPFGGRRLQMQHEGPPMSGTSGALGSQDRAAGIVDDDPDGEEDGFDVPHVFGLDA
ncbi:unnamed protein product [Symbiodinium sp. CCMP2456]|nr:unnamed protein product [Symbiodinium sp. CCMP2456]